MCWSFRCASSSAPLEKLYRPLVTFGRRARAEGAEVATLTGARVFLARVETILAALNLLYHRYPSLSGVRAIHSGCGPECLRVPLLDVALGVETRGPTRCPTSSVRPRLGPAVSRCSSSCLVGRRLRRLAHRCRLPRRRAVDRRALGRHGLTSGPLARRRTTTASGLPRLARECSTRRGPSRLALQGVDDCARACP
jgi:hypothetical protein